MDEMTLWGGSLRDEEIPVEVRRLEAGAGQIACIECDGTGIWTVLPGDGPIRARPARGPGGC